MAQTREQWREATDTSSLKEALEQTTPGSLFPDSFLEQQDPKKFSSEKVISIMDSQDPTKEFTIDEIIAILNAAE